MNKKTQPAPPDADRLLDELQSLWERRTSRLDGLLAAHGPLVLQRPAAQRPLWPRYAAAAAIALGLVTISYAATPTLNYHLNGGIGYEESLRLINESLGS